MDPIIDKIQQELRDNIDQHTKDSGQRFFKEDIKAHGVKTTTVKRISKDHFRPLKDQSKAVIFELCEKLWQTGYIEESFIACQWSFFLHKHYEPSDLDVFEKWIANYVNNWASCDTLCNHTVGEFLEMYPKSITRLKKWARSENRWMCRAAAVSLIIPARKGMFLEHVLEIAAILLPHKDDLVQKGYGWMLKVASQSHQKEIYDYVMSKRTVMPRTALRYAIEKMPRDLRSRAMERVRSNTIRGK